MSRKFPRDVPHGEPLRTCERWNTSLSWPCPIDGRLDGLVRLAIEAGEGESLTRAELLAALVLAAEPDGDGLVNVLRTYRRAKAGDAVLPSGGDQADGNVIRFGARKPGRRPSGR